MGVTAPSSAAGFEREIKFNPSELFSSVIGSSKTYYAYEGGLTTPGCAEIVNWFVLEDTLKIT